MIQHIEWFSVKEDLPSPGERVLIKCGGSVDFEYSFGTIILPWLQDPLKYCMTFLFICTERDQKEHEVRVDEHDMWFWTRLT